MRLAALQSVVNAGPAGSSGSPRPRRRRDFPRVPVAPRPASSPVPLRDRVHPLVSSASSSEYVPLRTCPPHGCEVRLPWGLVPNRDISRGDPLVRGRPRPALRSVLGVSHTLDGLLPPRPRGLVSSPNHVRDSPFRGLFPPPSRTASSAARALLSLSTGACPHVAAAAPAPMISPSGLRSGWRSAATDGVFSSGGARSPRRLLLLRVPTERLGGTFTPPPLTALAVRSCV